MLGSGIRPKFVVALAVAPLVTLGACSENPTFRFRLNNDTGVTLQVHAVENGQRVAEDALVNSGDSYGIDPNGFDLAFYDPRPTNEVRPNALYVQVVLDEQDGAEVLTRITYNVVPPGQEGSDPDEQPVLMDDVIVDVPPQTGRVRIEALPGFEVLYSLE